MARWAAACACTRDAGKGKGALGRAVEAYVEATVRAQLGPRGAPWGDGGEWRAVFVVVECTTLRLICDSNNQASSNQAKRRCRREPSNWPQILDIQSRVETAGLLASGMWRLERAVMQLHELPAVKAGGAARPPLADLLHYLEQRQRSGLVKLSHPPRLLYLIPPAAFVAEAIGVD